MFYIKTHFKAKSLFSLTKYQARHVLSLQSQKVTDTGTHSQEQQDLSKVNEAYL